MDAAKWVPDSRFAASGMTASLVLLQIAQNLPRGIVSRQSGHPAARMRAGAAHVEAGEWAAIVRMPQHRARGKHLPEIERAVKDVAADQTEGAFEIERREALPAEH